VYLSPFRHELVVVRSVGKKDSPVFLTTWASSWRLSSVAQKLRDASHYSETFTDTCNSRVDNFNVFCLQQQRQLLRVSWGDHITNEAICKQTKLTSLTELISRRRTSLFGHIARLDAAVPAHQALWLQTNISTGRNPGTSWKRLPGRPRKTWTSQIPDDTGMSSRAYWDASIRRGHERGTLRSLKTTRWWWWWWWWWCLRLDDLEWPWRNIQSERDSDELLPCVSEM